MKTFYGVNVEFYDNGEVKAYMTVRQAKERPHSQQRRVHKMTTFTIWLMYKVTADHFLAGIIAGKITLDDVLYVYSGKREGAAA